MISLWLVKTETTMVWMTTASSDFHVVVKISQGWSTGHAVLIGFTTRSHENDYTSRLRRPMMTLAIIQLTTDKFITNDIDIHLLVMNQLNFHWNNCCDDKLIQFISWFTHYHELLRVSATAAATPFLSVHELYNDWCWDITHAKYMGQRSVSKAKESGAEIIWDPD